MSERKIFIAIPTWKRFQMTIDSFKEVLDDDRVSNVFITDDASDDDSYEKLKWHFRDKDKVKLFQNKKNKNCYFNKHQAMENAYGEYGVLLDSDNTLSKDYIDALFSIPEWSRHVFYQPEFSKPYFNFTKWSGLRLTKENVSQYADTDLMTALNAANYFIHREEYLKVFDDTFEPISSDSIFFSKCWLEAGNTVLITPNLSYQHFIDPNGNGHYQTHSHLAVDIHKKIMDEIRQLK